ncbi:MAG: FtsX-like permease family protein, partial [Sporomusa sp.]
VSADTDVADGFLKVRNVVSIISIVLIAVLFIISIFIISNTTKLATFDRRDEIAIMKMVGATNSFIRWPFVFQGFLLGIFAALLAFIILWIGYEFLGSWIMNSAAGGIISVISFSTLAQNILLVFVGVGFLVGVLGSVVTIRNYLKV